MEKKDFGEVSVIIPTYYRNDRLEKAIKSVKSQSYENIETIVVDDSGERHAEEVVQGFNDIQYLPNPENKGLLLSRYIGYKAAGGQYIQFLDDDDRIKPTKISKQVKLLSQWDDVGVVYCGIEQDTGREVLPNKTTKGNILKEALRFNLSPCMVHTMLIDREVLRQIVELKDLISDEFGLKIEIAKETKFDFIDEALAYRGTTEGSMGSSMTAVENRMNTIEHYHNLYDEFEEEVYFSALAKAYHLKGIVKLSNSGWSLSAIKSFGKATKYTPDNRLTYMFSFLLSFFGYSSWNFARSMYSEHVLGHSHRGKHI